jgi:hypothetical protein
MRLKSISISIVFVTACLRVAAQNAAPSKDSTIKGSTIEVIQSYKPEIKQAPKPEWIPVLPSADTSRPVFTYEVPQQTLFYTYSSLPLRPLALGKDTIKNPYPDYVKFGGGNLSTLYLDAGISSLQGKDYETAIHVHHISQQGDIQNQSSSLTGLEADGTLHRDGKDWHAAIDAKRDQYSYYGYDHDLYSYSRDSVKQVFTGVRLNLDMQDQNQGGQDLNYHPYITAALYTDHYNATETSIGFDVPATYKLDTSLRLDAGINGILTQLKTPGQSSGNNILQIAPGLNYHKNALTVGIYLEPTFGKGDIYLLPDFSVTYHKPNSLFVFNAGWHGALRQNTYEQLSTENPYIFNIYDVHQTHTDEVYAGVQGALGNHLSFSGRLSWWHFDGLPVFLNSTGDEKQFDVLFADGISATSLKADIRYRIGNVFSIGGDIALYNFNTGGSGHLYYQPNVRLKGDMIYNPIPKLAISAYLAFLNGIYALDKGGNEVELDPILDIGGNAEYAIIPRLSVFIQVNNLLGTQYQRWLGYEAYGINLYGGLRFKFK